MLMAFRDGRPLIRVSSLPAALSPSVANGGHAREFLSMVSLVVHPLIHAGVIDFHQPRLDRGGGKDLSLPECPREQLEKEVRLHLIPVIHLIHFLQHVHYSSSPHRELCEWDSTLYIHGPFRPSRHRYLSPEQRGSQLSRQRRFVSSHTPPGLNYLVKVDADGKLRWERTGKFVDTAAGHWKDAGNGRGIVREERPGRPDPPPRTSFGSSGPPSPTSVAFSEPSDDHRAAAIHHAPDPKSHNLLQRVVKRNITPKGLVNKLLKKTTRRNTWIYVSVGKQATIPYFRF